MEPNYIWMRRDFPDKNYPSNYQQKWREDEIAWANRLQQVQQRRFQLLSQYSCWVVDQLGNLRLLFCQHYTKSSNDRKSQPIYLLVNALDNKTYPIS